jgi:hypothetical protein
MLTRGGGEAGADGPDGLVGDDDVPDDLGAEAAEVLGQLQRADLLVEPQLVFVPGLADAENTTIMTDAMEEIHKKIIKNIIEHIICLV